MKKSASLFLEKVNDKIGVRSRSRSHFFVFIGCTLFGYMSGRYFRMFSEEIHCGLVPHRLRRLINRRHRRVMTYALRRFRHLGCINRGNERVSNNPVRQDRRRGYIDRVRRRVALYCLRQLRYRVDSLRYYRRIDRYNLRRFSYRVGLNRVHRRVAAYFLERLRHQEDMKRAIAAMKYMQLRDISLTQ